MSIIGLALAAVFAMSAFMAAGASAAEWLINGAAIATAKKIKSKGELLLSDDVEKVSLLCKGTDEGTVGPGTLDEVTLIEATECVFEGGEHGACEEGKAVTAKALGLPWTTKIEGTRDDITSATSVGWNVECTVFGVFKVSDECTIGLSSTALENVTGGVNAIFDASTPAANCTRGGAGAGLVNGTDLNENPGAKEILTVG